MASQEELNKQSQLNDEKNEQISLEKELIAILARRAGIDSSILSDQQDISNALKDQVKFLKFQNAEKSLLTSLTTKINNIARDSYTISQDQLGLEKTNKKLTEDRKTLGDSIVLLNQQQLKFSKENDKLSQDIATSIKEQVEQTKTLLDNLNEIEKTSNAVSKNFGVKTFGALSDITKAIPGLNRFSEPFQQASEAARKVSITNTSIDKFKALRKEGMGLSDALAKTGLSPSQVLAGKSSPLLAGVKSLGPALTKALGPVTLIVELIKGIMQADKETTELQKSMALTKTEAVGFRMGLTEAANQSGNINITATKLLKTFGDLNKQFGFITNFASSTLVTMTKLTGVVGVSSESAGNLAAASELTGTSFESNYKDVLGTSYELQRQSGVQMDLRDILEQTGKVTGTVRANLGANPAQIAKAITQAKLFGASLEQVANAGKSLLQFEESISSELEAELLLGRDINLERARAAALAGDQVTLAQELQKEAGTFSDFTKMNVIQQEALAKAMGMTSDQLADILFQQEVQGKSAKELRALGKEDLAQRVEAQDLQTKFNATVEKLQGIFADVGTAITPILQILGSALSIVGALVGLIGDIVKMFQGDFSFSGFMGGLKSAGSGIVDAFGATQPVQDGIAPSDRGPFTITDSYGTTAITAKGDGIAVSPNINQGSDNAETKRTNQLLESSVRALEELTKLSARPSVFQIGTDDFYTATSKYSYQVQ